MSEESTYRQSKRRRWPWVILLSLFLLLLLARLSLMTGFVRSLVKEQVLSAANEQLNVTLNLDGLEGDLWKEVILKGISITDTRQDTLASIDSLQIGYNLLSYFSDSFEISSITVNQPYLKFRQQDSVVNVATWLKDSPSDGEPASSEPFPLTVDTFSITGGRIDAVMDVLPRDSAFVLDAIQVNSSFALLSDGGYRAGISNFSFNILETPLSESISVTTSLQAEKQSINLEKLVIATGRSMLQSNGRVNVEDSSATLDLKALPLAWRDIASYVGEMPIKQNLELGLSLEGKAQNLVGNIHVEATGIENLDLGVGLTWKEGLQITSAKISSDRIDAATVSGDSSLPEILNLDLNGKGNIPIANIESGFFEAKLSTGVIQYQGYMLDSLRSDLALSEGRLQADVETSNQQQLVQASIDVNGTFNETPEFRAKVRGSRINPGYWLQDEGYEGDLSMSAEVKGNGFIPGSSPWHYEITFDQSEFRHQQFRSLTLNGTITEQAITNETRFSLSESEMRFNGQVRNYQQVPQFRFTLASDAFNLSEFHNMEDFESALSFEIEGEGSGASVQDLKLLTKVRMDSSIFNGERINRLNADISVEDTVALVQPAELQSTIAEGSFNARMHLARWYDIDNELNLDLTIKDIGSLAPVVDVDELRAEGTVIGKLAPVTANELTFSGDLDLQNLVYDSLFSADNASGDINVKVKEEPEFNVALDLVSPSFSAVQLRDISVQADGRIGTMDVAGNFRLNFQGPKDSQINHAGTYLASKDSSSIHTEEFELTTQLRTLYLEKPFELQLKNDAVRMDTMRLASGDGATLELAVPYADSVRQEGYLVGRNLDLSAIQNTLLSESYFEGILSGNLTVANSDTSFETSGDLFFSDLNYQGTSLDSLRLELDIGSDQLKGNLFALDGGQELMTGELNLPFRLGNPEEFDPAFFDKPVNGFFKLRRVSLSRFDTLLTRMGILDTQGLLEVRADLSGTAGRPQLVSKMTLDSATVSGVQVDSVTASLQYIHEESELTMNATVNSLKQRAAEITARAPFYLDLKNGSVTLPGENDSLFVNIDTNNFNLAAFNDFVDREQVRNIKGQVNGTLQVRGTLNDLETKGRLEISKGSVRVVPTGVTVDGISSNFIFKPDLLTIENFRANSENGSLTMAGSLGLNELVPGEVNMTLRARNFKVANTSQYNGAIDLDTKMTGSLTNPKVSGSLSVLNGFVQLDNFGEKSVESVQLNPDSEPEQALAIYDSLSLDMDVSFNRRFFIRNQQYLEMEVQLEGSVDLLKDPGEELQMFGTLEAVSGYARPLGKRFELEEGVISFVGNPENPDLQIRTLFKPPQPEEEVMIWYIIGGNVEEPEFKYESSPPMELEDILCYTLFGQPCYVLESWKRVVASSGSNSTASDLALEVVMDRIESLATQRLGIDVVKIDNTRVGGEAGTSITTGWYINPKVFFAIQNVITGSSPDTSFLLEYLLKKNLKLIISQGNDSRQGVDLKWNYDY